ncbi:MAG: DUF2333 family protein [Desulfobacterales bacterium]|nr:DUF2333 family protein [Desulfobacterales bacterium]
MENENPQKPPQIEDDSDVKKDPEFKKFALTRILVGIVAAVLLLWGGVVVIGLFDRDQPPIQMETGKTDHSEEMATTTEAPTAAKAPAVETRATAEEAHAPAAKTTASTETAQGAPAASQPPVGERGAPAAPSGPPGVAFTEALIGPLSYELRERFWGWRPNDILNVTDNVNNIQLGVLEVTRRATVQLNERISRTGTTAALDPHLNQAMNWLMVKAEEYWFPSAETKYKDAMDELALYRDRLRRGEAAFFTRADNLIPLLAAFEDLLGSSDENLVKQFEDDGEPVSHFMADDYFYYAQGVAMAMHQIMEAVAVDFHTTLENRNGVDVIHHAIHSLDIARNIRPWYITDADLDGILANHRANIAAPISHARFYVNVLIKTLST